MKRKTYFIIILLFYIVAQSHSQDFWEQVYFPDTLTIKNITFDNQQRTLIGTSAGVYRSTANGGDWKILGLNDEIINSISLNNNGDIYAGAAQDPFWNNGLFRSTDNGSTWEDVLPDIGAYGDVVKILSHGDTLYASLWMGGARLIRTMDNCQTWDSVFGTDNNSEYISDILVSNGGEIIISLSAYMEGMGGVYKSSDWGNTWEYSGLFNHQVRCLAKNSSDDIFAGSWGGLGYEGWKGIYVLRNGQSQWDTLTWAPQVDDIVVNIDEDIYITTSSASAAVLRSENDGLTFEVINTGLPVGNGMGYMEINDEGYLYLTSSFLSSYLAKSLNTTVNIQETVLSSKNNFYTVFPNPVSHLLNIKSYSKENSIDNATVKIFNTKGELIFSEKMNSVNNITKLKLNYLKAGMYIIEIADKSSISYLKIVKH